MTLQAPVFDAVLYVGMLLLPIFVVASWLHVIWRIGGFSNWRGISAQTLVNLQIFRLVLELLMLRAALLGIMPTEFSMQGYNYDVLTGMFALLLSITAHFRHTAPKAVLWAFNTLGIVCLIVIATLAVLTSANVHAFGTDAMHINSWVAHFPYIMLPTVMVSLAALGHLLLTIKLLRQDASSPSINP